MFVVTDQHSLNQLRITTAIIKEALRLFPPVSGSRAGEPGFTVTEDGHPYPTEDFMVWLIQRAIHHEPLYWSQPDRFIPERWLVSRMTPCILLKEPARPSNLPGTYHARNENCHGDDFTGV